MAVRTVLVCETQVPFVRGGAELLVRQLVDQLRMRGYETDRFAGGHWRDGFQLTITVIGRSSARAVGMFIRNRPVFEVS